MKKELRIMFNLNNKKEKDLYNYLSEYPSMSGMLKQIGIMYMENETKDNKLIDILQDINNTLKNITINNVNNLDNLHDDCSVNLDNITEINTNDIFLDEEF